MSVLIKTFLCFVVICSILSFFCWSSNAINKLVIFISHVMMSFSINSFWRFWNVIASTFFLYLYLCTYRLLSPIHLWIRRSCFQNLICTFPIFDATSIVNFSSIASNIFLLANLFLGWTKETCPNISQDQRQRYPIE